jgi:UDP-N-acetylmuramate--alanine ligase
VTASAHPEAGLAPARPARPILPRERIHVVGAAGAGASAAALHGRWAGALTDGCDPGGPSPYTPALDAAGIVIAPAHDPLHVLRTPPPDRLAVTKALTAVEPNHPELAAARDAGIPIEPWQQVIADAATDRELIGVAGTHGKSTTAGWLVHVLVACALDPAAFVGALLPSSLTGGVPATARQGDGPFVVEADEYAGNFDAYRPGMAILTTAEWDHPDVFADRDAVIAAFAAWVRAMATGRGPTPTLVANVGDAGVRELVGLLRDWSGRIVPTAIVDGDDGPGVAEARAFAGAGTASGLTGRAIVGRITGVDPGGTTLEVEGVGAAATTLRLQTAGRHNASNALAVIGAALASGADPDAVLAAVGSFGGVGRRLERKGEEAGVVVFDDYGHHPTAIRATLEAVRQRAPGRRVWAVYEPLTYHRTAALLDDFADVLATADGVAIADIWPGRDRDLTTTSAAALADAVAERNPSIPVAAPGSVETTATWLGTQVRPGDAVLVMGGGRSYRIGELLLEGLAAR